MLALDQKKLKKDLINLVQIWCLLKACEECLVSSGTLHFDNLTTLEA